MKPLLRVGGIFALVAASALCQTPPAQPAATVAGKAAEPVVAKPLETSTKSGSALEFKVEGEKDLLPPPPVVPSGAKVDKAPVARPSPESPQGPVAPPAGPQIVDSPQGPAVVPEPAGSVAAPSVLPGSGPGRGGVQANTQRAKPYVIGPLDVLEVKVWNDPKLSGMLDVATDGTISMPLIGSITASGLTVAELTVGIKDRLTAIIIEPEVTVQVVRNNSKKFSIFGGCARQGEFPLLGEVTVLDAFANCGGFKDFANLKKIYILRGTQKLKFNYRDVIQGKHMEQNIALENGDRIVIPE